MIVTLDKAKGVPGCLAGANSKQYNGLTLKWRDPEPAWNLCPSTTIVVERNTKSP